jgi:hypothetical protein
MPNEPSRLAPTLRGSLRICDTLHPEDTFCLQNQSRPSLVDTFKQGDHCVLWKQPRE